METPHTRQAAIASRQLVDGILTRWIEGVATGASRPLFGLNEVHALANEHSAGHGYTTVTPYYGNKASLVIDTDEEFRAQFYEQCPCIADFDFASVGLVLAGGAACRWMRKSAHWSMADLDFFMVGHDTDAVVALEAVAEYLARTCDSIECKRTPTYVEFVCGQAGTDKETRIQIILCKYADIGEVLYGFDLGSSAVAWDGKRVWLSEAGVYAHAFMRNIVCLPFRGPGYEIRLTRYFGRGFSIVMPNLRVRDIAGNISLDMKRLEIKVRGVTGNCDCDVSVCLVPKVQDAPSHYEIYRDIPREITRRCLDAVIRPDAPRRLITTTPYTPSCFQTPGVAHYSVNHILSILPKYGKFPGDVSPWIRLLGAEAAMNLFIEQADQPDNAKNLAVAAIEHRFEGLQFEVPIDVSTTEGAASVWDVFPRTPDTPEEWYGEWYQN